MRMQPTLAHQQDELSELIKKALQKISGGYGSIEIIVQDHTVKQINTREITKAHVPIDSSKT
jgi:hypothetical protein